MPAALSPSGKTSFFFERIFPPLSALDRSRNQKEMDHKMKKVDVENASSKKKKLIVVATVEPGAVATSV